MSESAAGGNYNLRYISAALRRGLTPFPATHRSPTQATSVFGLRDRIAYTLYVPAAGFLWSDSMIWKQSLPQELLNKSTYLDIENGKHWFVEGSHRVFFRDKFIERYLWEVQDHLRPQYNPNPQIIRSGHTIRLYDQMADRYLCVIPEERVASEAGYFTLNDNAEQSLSRIRVGSVYMTVLLFEYC